MTEMTFKRLQAELQRAKEKASELEVSLGKTQESAQDWHDNPAYDYLVQDVKLAWSKVQKLEAALKDVIYILPRIETEHVDIGNTVEVLYQGESDPESFTILGKEDSNTEPNWISCESALAQLLIGKSRGVVVKLPSGMQVELLEILPGQFSPPNITEGNRNASE